MTAYERFKASNAWETKYNIPLSPMNNNPFFYAACAAKLILRRDGFSCFNKIQADYLVYALLCERFTGLFDRWPDGKGGMTSHDELIGIAYMSSDLAKDILSFLDRTDGIYMNKDASPGEIEEQFNLFRFVWFRPYLLAAAERKVSLLSQLGFASHLIWDMFTAKPDDASGRLLIWMMSDAMMKYPLSGLFVEIWRVVMKARGFTLKHMFELEPKENPIFAELAPDDFR